MKRRIFLQGIGGAAVAAPFLSSYSRVARAADPPPVRSIIFFTHNGCNTNKFFPVIEHGALTKADLSPTLAPLGDYVDQLLIPRGFASLNGYGRRQSVDPHNQAMGSKLTCAAIQEGRETNFAMGMSVDHEIAKQLNKPGVAPLLLSVGQKSTSIKEVLSFSAPETPYASEVNPAIPYAALTDVFSTAEPGGGVPAPVTAADYKVLRGNSVIDLISEDLQRYKARNMSKADKDRTEIWLSLLRKTETDMMGTGGMMAGAGCSGAAGTFMVDDASVKAAGTGVAGSRSGAFNFNYQKGDETAKSFTLGGDMMLNLIALSAICDTNRSMGMIYPGYVIFTWDGMTHQYDHHGLSHRDGTLDIDNQCVDGVMGMIAQIDNWYAGKYAKLVGLLKSIPEGDVNVLHNSATMWLPELSDGDAHNLNNLPIVIAGSAGGKLKQGQAINVEGGASKKIGQGGSENGCTASMNTSGSTGSAGGNVPINKLYVTLMNAFGMTDGGQPWTKWGAFDNDNKNGEAFTNPGEIKDLLAT
jgi:Protein of unknown function (DUF1552)